MQRTKAERIANFIGLPGIITVLAIALSVVTATLTTLVSGVDDLDTPFKVIFFIAAIVVAFTVIVLLIRLFRFVAFSIMGRTMGRDHDDPAVCEERHLTPEIEMRSAWASNFISDTAFLELCAHVVTAHIDPQGISAQGVPYLDFRFLVLNETHLNLRIGETFDGAIHYADKPLPKPEISEKVSWLTHGEAKWVVARQFLTGMEDEIQRTFGQEIEFGLLHLDLHISSEYPDNSAGPTGRVRIPAKLPITIMGVSSE